MKQKVDVTVMGLKFEVTGDPIAAAKSNDYYEPDEPAYFEIEEISFEGHVMDEGVLSDGCNSGIQDACNALVPDLLNDYGD